MHVITLRCDNLPPIYFEQHANTWTPKKEDARKFATAEEAKSFIIVWRLTDGALVERV